MIKAKAWSKCGTKTVEFDATPYFEQASKRSLIKLIQCDFKLSNAANNVAYFTVRHDESVEGLFQFLASEPTNPHTYDLNDFECAINTLDAYAWLSNNRPEWIDQVLDLSVLSLVTIQTPRERHESLREALENLADQYDVEAIIDRLAHICNAIAHRATNDWHDDDLAVAYTKLSTDLKHVKDTSLLTDAYTAHLKRLQSEITSDS